MNRFSIILGKDPPAPNCLVCNDTGYIEPSLGNEDGLCPKCRVNFTSSGFFPENLGREKAQIFESQRIFNNREIHRLIRYGYHHDPVISTSIDLLVYDSVGRVDYGLGPTSRQLALDVATDFFLFGNCFVSFDTDHYVILDPDNIQIIREPGSPCQYRYSRGSIELTLSNVHHLSRRINAYDYWGIPIISFENNQSDQVVAPYYEGEVGGKLREVYIDQFVRAWNQFEREPNNI